jgi:hypothetical protein
MPSGREYRELTSSELMAWAGDNTQVMRLRTSRDILPGGFMAALAPVVVDWRASRIADDQPYAVLRNVNYGGNPLERTTVLHSARVPLDGVEFAEFTLVPSTRRGGLLAPAHHAQLRFVFQEGKEPELLNLATAHTGTDARFPDVILSWETWRAPDKKFNLLEGLARSAFTLSLRVYAGPQRFLEDSLRERDWFSYRLRLPGGAAGLAEILKVGLALGDGAARQTISRLLEEGEDEWARHAPAAERESDDSVTQWEELRARAARSELKDADPRLRLAPEEQTYQSLLRSCAALARYTVVTATRRMMARGHTEGVVSEGLPEAALGTPEPWMEEAARTDIRGMFLRAPQALRYLLHHPESIPSRIPSVLNACGLLERRGSDPWVVRYSRQANRPYGSSGVNRVT